ncbi:hypothetical protein F4778DRAFT_19769 [Xylariomycetidae sp. FL2044]|nr:hypothetical protein F4778DRAFT_19769 [Xylariomycetidae sp. FL2044]
MRRYVGPAWLYLTRSVFVVAIFVSTPLLIILYFTAGGNCVAPQPADVHLMPDHACCGQGLAFLRSKVENELLKLFRSNRWSRVATDSFIEEYADATDGLRWALTPVVMQHVGGKSSHGVNRGRGNAPDKIWNFGFKRNDAPILAAEYLAASDSSSGSQIRLGLHV